jgi:hypothetical protein
MSPKNNRRRNVLQFQLGKRTLHGSKRILIGATVSGRRPKRNLASSTRNLDWLSAMSQCDTNPAPEG